MAFKLAVVLVAISVAAALAAPGNTPSGVAAPPNHRDIVMGAVRCSVNFPPSSKVNPLREAGPTMTVTAEGDDYVCMCTLKRVGLTLKADLLTRDRDALLASLDAKLVSETTLEPPMVYRADPDDGRSIRFTTRGSRGEVYGQAMLLVFRKFSETSLCEVVCVAQSKAALESSAVQSFLQSARVTSTSK